MPQRKGLTGAWLITMVTLVNVSTQCWFGYDSGVFSGVMVSSDFFTVFPQANNADISGITSSSYLLGAFFGAVAAFILGDLLGRKKTTAIGLGCNILGCTLQASAWSLGQMIAGRVLNGVGIGLTSSMGPIFLAECAPSRLRGKLIALGTAFNVASFCLVNWIAYGMFFRSGAFQWRFPVAFQLSFTFFIAWALLSVPESPRWLLLVNRDEEALAIIARLAGADVAVDDPVVMAEYRSIQAAIALERKAAANTMDVLRFRDKTQNIRRLLLSCGTQLMQQISGCNAIGFYLPTLLQQCVGFDQEMSRLMNAVNGTQYLCAALASLLLIDRLGRRNLMLWGAAGMGVCYLVASLALRTAMSDPSRQKTMGNVVTAFFFLYYTCFGLTWASLPWVYASEVNSIGWRSRGAAAASATSWISGFIVVQFAKAGIDNMGWAFFLMFGIICFAQVPVVYLFYPETAGKSLEQMDEVFIKYPSAFVFGNRDMTRGGQSATPTLVDREMNQTPEVEQVVIVVGDKEGRKEEV